MGISLNSDVVKKYGDLHRKIHPHQDMGISMNIEVVKTMVTCIRKLTHITMWKKGLALNDGVF